MLRGQNGKRKLKKRSGSWKTAVVGSVSLRVRVCAPVLASTTFGRINFQVAKNIKILTQLGNLAKTANLTGRRMRARLAFTISSTCEMKENVKKRSGSWTPVGAGSISWRVVVYAQDQHLRNLHHVK